MVVAGLWVPQGSELLDVEDLVPGEHLEGEKGYEVDVHEDHARSRCGAFEDEAEGQTETSVGGQGGLEEAEYVPGDPPYSFFDLYVAGQLKKKRISMEGIA